MKTLDSKEFYQVLEEKLETCEGEVCSIKIVAEDDGTFDIAIWDEREGESHEELEEGHFVTYEAANKRLEEIVKENTSITFIRMKDDM